MSAMFDYYYNKVPTKGYCRNNLVYTSLISKDKKTFCQWFYNDIKYHGNKNEVVDPTLMEEKFQREVKGLTTMEQSGYADLIPKFDINFKDKKIYLEVDGPDMWEKAGCATKDYSSVVLDWQDQMLEIFKAHKEIGMFKFSLHPSSYFIVKNRLKSINYFFSFFYNDPLISPSSVMSHISEDRKTELFPMMEKMGICIDKKYPFIDLQILAFESFKNNFPNKFIERAKQIYV